MTSYPCLVTLGPTRSDCDVSSPTTNATGPCCNCRAAAGPVCAWDGGMRDVRPLPGSREPLCADCRSEVALSAILSAAEGT